MSDKIWYCEYCWIYAAHPEIEKPCSNKHKASAMQKRISHLESMRKLQLR